MVAGHIAVRPQQNILLSYRRDQAGDCPALRRALCKPYHRTAASKPTWPFWKSCCRRGLGNTSHFWLCFLMSLCRSSSSSTSSLCPPSQCCGELLWVESFWKLLGVAVPLCARRGENPNRETFLKLRETASSCLPPTLSSDAYLGARGLFITRYMHNMGNLFVPQQKMGSGPRGVVMFGCMPSCWD